MTLKQNFAKHVFLSIPLKMPLFDFCFNFTSGKFRQDEQSVVRRANQAGVSHFLIPGSDQEDSKHAAELAERYSDGFYAAVGVHPHMAKSWQDNTRTVLSGLAQSQRVRAIGEAGLDYNRNFSTQAQQEYAFREQIKLAISCQLPLFLHERDAHEDFLSILQDYRHDIGPTVVHCFTGSQRALENYLKMGLYIGITGWICDERRGTHLHELVRLIPQERLVIETDAPYLFPRSYRPRPKKMINEPCYLPHIAQQVALHRGDGAESLSDYTMANAIRFLNL